MLRLKGSDSKKSDLTEFDLLNYNEDALSSITAYLLANDRDFYFDFLENIIGISRRKSWKHFSEVEIKIQDRHDEGIPDIEILKDNDYQIIIECKIGKNSVTSQRTQYIPVFEEDAEKYLLFLTQEYETFELSEDVKDVYATWWDIFSLISQNRKKYNDEIFEKFNRFAERGFSMTKFAKEILVQDLSDPKEIKRFDNYHIYRRKESSGKPLYFAPHFTKSSDKQWGISRLARVLGALTLTPDEREDIGDRLDLFAKEFEEADSQDELVQKWKEGLKIGDPEEQKTYYFLDKPVELPGVAKKSKVEKSEGWIGGAIPANRTISFQNLMKQVD